MVGKRGIQRDPEKLVARNFDGRDASFVLLEKLKVLKRLLKS